MASLTATSAISGKPGNSNGEHPNCAKRGGEAQNIREISSRINRKLYINTRIRENYLCSISRSTPMTRKHASRLVNYMYFQAEQLSSVGSGAVESAVKQIDKRLQIVGAQWKYENLPQMLSLRCAYLNGFLAPTF